MILPTKQKRFLYDQKEDILFKLLSAWVGFWFGVSMATHTGRHDGSLPKKEEK